MARGVAAGGERIGPKGLGKLLQAGVLFLAALNGGVAFGQGTTSQTDAANDAKTWAKGVSKSTYNAKTLITSGNVSATPTYTGTDATSQNVTSLKGLFQGGQGSTASSSQNASISCASTAATNLDCQAATLGGVNANNPYTSSITSSTMYQTSVGVIQAQKDASTAASTVGGLGGGVGQTCVTDTVTTPPVSETETCTVYMNPAESSCTVNQVVQVDADYLYQCEKKSSKDVGHTCVVGDVVVVDPDYEYGCKVKVRQDTVETCNKKLTVTCETFDAPPCVNPIVTVSVVGSSSPAPVYSLSQSGQTYTLNASFRSGYTATQNIKIRINVKNLSQVSAANVVLSNPGVYGDVRIYTVAQVIDVASNSIVQAFLAKDAMTKTGNILPYLKEGDTDIALVWNCYQGTCPATATFSLNLPGTSYCAPAPEPVCTDTWDDSSCQALAARH